MTNHPADPSRLHCPTCRAALDFHAPAPPPHGDIRCTCGLRYPVVAGVPRFVPDESYTHSFGVEWKRFSRTQLDSANGTRISRCRFLQITGIEPEMLRGRRVLEVGCGMGRFLEVVSEAGAEAWGADLSLAVEVAAENLAGRPNCQVVQADLFHLPFADDFDLVYSFGVLHHTPDSAAAFRAIARHLRPGGRIVAWVYGLGEATGIQTRWVPRPHQLYGPLVRALPESWRERVLRAYTGVALKAGTLRVAGDLLRHVLPIQDLRRKGPTQDGWEPDGNPVLRERIRHEWALHSAFDMMTPTYVRQHGREEVIRWAESAGLVDVQSGPVATTVLATRPR